MTAADVALLITGLLLVLAAGVVVVRADRRDQYAVRYVERRTAESHRAVLSARLIPEPQELPGRPSAAGTARPVYKITDAPWRNQAPGRTERSQ